MAASSPLFITQTLVLTPTCRFLTSMSKRPNKVAPLKLNKSCSSSIIQEKIEVLKSLESWASHQVLPFLKPVEQSWQPHDFLPDPSLLSDEFIDQIKALRDRMDGLPDEYFVVLVGDMITEDGLPMYQTLLNSTEVTSDKTGSSQSPWAIWTRSWTAEERRHGDLLRAYLYLSGRVDMRMIQKTVHYLITNGNDLGLENDPYLGAVYTSFQERATAVSHGNTARLAKEGGDPVLARVCATIAADEKRHEKAYSSVVQKLLEVDPNGAMIAIGDVMRKGVTMPAHLMYDGQDPHLFHHFCHVAQRIGVYTADDYIGIMEFLIGRWKLEKLEGITSDEGKRAQDYVCGLAQRMRKIQERTSKIEQPVRAQFSWIFNKEISI